ncbi:heme-binding protein 1-like [Pimephales promelas]|uniref:heme-binding protein 1-like n=1 Tax=Pimephales promelas TaxID=90988 RepID=UPI001955B592|nr:heme-binding protein 1-like [Pimephales promelas]
MALISIEDLDGLDDEQVDDDITDSSEPMDDGEQDRMYAHWQAVGRTHHVSVPREMRGPIEEMTRRNQSSEREQVPFVSISRHEKLGEVLYEERVYPAGKWACVSKADMMYEQSISNAFMQLMRFICKENSTGRYLGMSVPVVNEITLVDDGSTFMKEVLTAYYLPAEFQARPPQPTDPDISIVHRDSIRVISRYFIQHSTTSPICCVDTII